MAKTRNTFPGPREEEEYQCFETGSVTGMITGALRYVTGSFQMRDEIGVFNPRSTPTASCCGQVLFSTDGLMFTAETPVTSQNGWLVNVSGTLLVVGP